MNSKDLEDDCVRQACDELNAYEYEMRDPAYEDNIMKKYKPVGEVTPEKMKIVDSFFDELRKKWQRQGYKGDRTFVDAFTSKYSIKPNDSVQQLKDFQPKR